MRRLLIALSLAALAGAAAVQTAGGQATAPAQPPAAADVAARLQKRYESIRDFTADFTQTFQGLLAKQPITERGKALLKKPNRVRFTYEKPEKKEFVSDGVTFRS